MAVISEDDIAVSLVTVSSMCWCESSLDIAGVVATSLTVGDVVAALENASACDAAYVADSEGAASYSLTRRSSVK